MNSRRKTTALATLALTASLALTACEGEAVDRLKGQETTPITSEQTANVRTQENSDPGLKAALAADYEPVAFVKDTDGNSPTYLILKVCDGAPVKDCLDKGLLDSAHPNVMLYVSSEPDQNKVVFEGGYALSYPTPGTGGRGDGIRCEAKTASDTSTGLSTGVVGDFVNIGKQVDETFADAANTTEKAIKLGDADLNCTANLV